jgi:hypothetical protein
MRILTGFLTIVVVVGLWPQEANADEDCFYESNKQHCTFTGSNDFFELTFTYTEELRVEIVYPAGEPCWILTTRPVPDAGELVGLGAGFTPGQLAEIEDFIRTSYAHCPAEYDVETSVWEVFASLELEIPEPVLAPEAAGITGLASYLTDEADTYVYWSGDLPSGVFAEVEATLDEVLVEWGDGAVGLHPASALAAEDGISHTYETKTCTAEYRSSHPRGHLCHPTLDSYPISVTYLWSGRYRTTGEWIEIGTRNLTTTIGYDVDEAIGVLRTEFRLAGARKAG